MYCVPDTHWKFEIVGRAGMRRSGLNSRSSDAILEFFVVSQRMF